MTIFQSIILGIVQGLTEFLPVSSSGHLVLVPHLMGWHIPADDAFVFDVLLQVATLIAVFTYFWKDLVEIIRSFLGGIFSAQPFGDPRAREGWLLILATIPAGAIGLAIKGAVEQAFNSMIATASFLFVTAGLLLVAERVGKRARSLESINWKDALWIGFFQVIAIFPGVSRSGATITGGMTRDLERPASARFSFLMSIPVILAAGLAASLDMLKIQNISSMLPIFIPGFVSAAIVGYLAIRWLLSYLTRHPLYIFSIYCAGVGLLALILGVLGR
jgi:undecaprenyl-diphosphatase